MSAFGDPVTLVAGGVAQGGASGQQWEGGFGVLMVDQAGGAGADFVAQCANGTFVPVADMATGAALTAVTVGTHAFLLPPCRIKMAAVGTTQNVQAIRCA
jgi:hypothetical protein